jgi:hypothetical protein
MSTLDQEERLILEQLTALRQLRQVYEVPLESAPARPGMTTSDIVQRVLDNAGHPLNHAAIRATIQQDFGYIPKDLTRTLEHTAMEAA